MVIQLVEEVSLPVHLETRRIERVEHALEGRPGDRASGVDRRSFEFANWREALLSLIEVASVAPDNRAHLLHVKLLGEWRRGGHSYKGEPAIDVFGRVQDKVAPVWQDRG